MRTRSDAPKLAGRHAWQHEKCVANLNDDGLGDSTIAEVAL